MDSADSYVLDTANGMWLDRDTFVLADFQHAIEKGYHAKVQSLDFSKTEEATSIINEWTSNQTHQEIPELLQSGDIDGSTRLVLTNAVYFKGSWVKPFDPKKTQEDSFFLDEASSVPVKMMKQAGSFSYFENETLQVLALPFVKKDEKSEIVCLFMLPKKDVPLLELESQISAASFQEWVGKLERKTITMKIPKFCLDNRFDLNQALKDLGMTGSFQSQADFSGIDGMRDLYLSKVVHETYFSLDEAGVTAAAATGASINVTATPPGTPPISFNCDHPFLFALVDLNTKLPLFWGKIQDPSMAQCE
jgi:serpin B